MRKLQLLFVMIITLGFSTNKNVSKKGSLIKSNNCALIMPQDSIDSVFDSIKNIDAVLVQEKIDSLDVSHAVAEVSWYGERFHGNHTASGEIYDMNKMTTAVGLNNGKKLFPFGTWLKVTNLRNNKSVIVKVNDTGSFHNKNKKRILDLSRGAFSKIANLDRGKLNVKIEVIPKGSSLIPS